MNIKTSCFKTIFFQMCVKQIFLWMYIVFGGVPVHTEARRRHWESDKISLSLIALSRVFQ